jgi:Lon-like ATP-dependent protease
LLSHSSSPSPPFTTIHLPWAHLLLFSHHLLRPSLASRAPRWVNPKPGQEDAVAEDESAQSASKSEDKPQNENDSSNSFSSDDPNSSSSDSAPPPQDDGLPPASNSNPPSPSSSSSSISIAKQSVPEIYPQVLALPIGRRPSSQESTKLSSSKPKNLQVVSAVKEMMERGQAYLGAFLLKAESDMITDVSVGVFAQITSVFAAPGGEGKEGEGLTAVPYPHRS